MNQPIIFDMHALAANAPHAEAASPGFVDQLLASVFQLSDFNDDVSADLLDRADAYEETQPAFAAELRAAVASAEADVVTVFPVYRMISII